MLAGFITGYRQHTATEDNTVAALDAVNAAMDPTMPRPTASDDEPRVPGWLVCLVALAKPAPKPSSDPSRDGAQSSINLLQRSLYA